MACAICDVRRPRRFCPGVRGDICTICCGTEREVTVDCPLDCVYLQEAHLHEKPAELDPAKVPNQDIRVSESFLVEHQALLSFMAQTLERAAAEAPGIMDNDLREALDGLTRTYRTLQSGVYYESRPANPLANHVFSRVQEQAAAFRESERKELGISRTRDADILGVLVFFQRLEYDRNNGRRRSRAFMDFLRREFGEPSAPAPASPSLIVP